VKARERGAAQERRIAAEYEADEILEDRLFDRVAVKFRVTRSSRSTLASATVTVPVW
jgi:hypothetical protein